MRTTPLLSAAIVLLALPLAAAQKVYVDAPITRTYPLDLAGSFWIDNPDGSIEVVGVEGTTATITAVRTTVALDKDALDEAHDNTRLTFECGPHQCFVHTLGPEVRSPRWSSSVKWTARVPKTVHVRVLAKRSADTIRIANIMGNVTVSAFSGVITLDNVSGASIVESVNGRIVYNYANRPVSHAQITAINADIEVHLPADSNFDWVADTLRRDLWTNLPLRGRWDGRVFRGSVNAPGGPTLTTSTTLGHVAVLANGATLADARSVRSIAPEPGQRQQTVGDQTMISPQPPHMARVQLPTVPAGMVIAERLADINIGEARGLLRVYTGAGAIELGTVYGDCTATSLGGPISVTEAMSNLIAHTGAGDILVRAARVGGSISTDGGLVKVLYTGGATTLRSGGGDIVVRQAAGPIDAETHSGDIVVNSDPTQKTQKISARTSRGNVTLNLSPRFGADVDATVLTSDNDAEGIYSDFAGLQIRKEQVGAKTKVHATGKINGGGERLELYAEDGTIHLNSSTASPATVTNQ
jgi:DUF4097 and DUF4098 domain-containing protein YvlB